MSRAWLEQRERGSLAALRLMTWLTRTLGYRAGRALLYPICAYFVLFSPRARRASRAWLARALGRPARTSDVFRHFHVFASTLHDRIEIGGGRSEEYTVELHGGDALDAALAHGRGCLLLGSHLGSFEILRVIGESRGRFPVNLVMHEDNARNTSRWLHALAPELARRVIAPGQTDTLLRVRDCLQRGEIVAMLGDRALGPERTMVCGFLGAPARFPSGPLLTAALLQAPVVTFCCLHRGARHYAAHFELLAERIEHDRATRDDVVARWLARYAAWLEGHARAAPFNWFNFYDFWRDAR